MTPEVQALLQIGLSILSICGLTVTGFAGFRVARENRKARQDETPADSNEATKIANDLILRLLDRANADVARYQELLDTVSEEAKNYEALARLVPALQEDLVRARRERDLLRRAVTWLEAKARVTGAITYAEVVEWAQLALDPQAHGSSFDSMPAPEHFEETTL